MCKAQKRMKMSLVSDQVCCIYPPIGIQLYFIITIGQHFQIISRFCRHDLQCLQKGEKAIYSDFKHKVNDHQESILHHHGFFQFTGLSQRSYLVFLDYFALNMYQFIRFSNILQQHVKKATIQKIKDNVYNQLAPIRV